MTESNRLAIALGIALAAGIALPVAAGEIKLQGHFAWGANGTSYQMEDGHTYWVGTFTGTYVDASKTAPFHGIGLLCPGYNDIGRNAAGYCIYTDAAGDKAFSEWSCENAPPGPGAILAGNCQNTYTGGTGKFAGISGSSPFITAITAFNPDGSASGFATWDLTVVLPD